MAVERRLGVELQAGAKLSDMLVKGRLEPAFTQAAALQPLRSERAHSLHQVADRQVRRTEELKWTRRAASLG